MSFDSIFLTVVVVLGFTGVLTWLSFRQKQSSWNGTIIDKIYEEAVIDDSGGRDEQFKLVCRTTEGKKVTIGIFKNDYAFFEIGDKVVKRKGDYMPTKITENI